MRHASTKGRKTTVCATMLAVAVAYAVAIMPGETASLYDHSDGNVSGWGFSRQAEGPAPTPL